MEMPDNRECMGIEPHADSLGNAANPAPGGAKSGALAALAALIDAWATLPEPIRAGVRALVGSITGPSGAGFDS
jgi:hypothetical protein